MISTVILWVVVNIPLYSTFYSYKARSLNSIRIFSSNDDINSNKFNVNDKKALTKGNRNGKMDESVDLILAFSPTGSGIFDFSTFTMNDNNGRLTKESFYSWEKQIDTLLIDIKSVTKTNAILSLYSSILKKASLQILDPLQTATFELIVFSLVDSLMNNHPDSVPITSLIESMTSINIAYVDEFAKLIDDGGSDGFVQIILFII